MQNLLLLEAINLALETFHFQARFSAAASPNTFKGNILTIGNGGGNIVFWDVRAAKFLESTMNTNRAVTLKASRGWVVSNFHQFNYKNFQKRIKNPFYIFT